MLCTFCGTDNRPENKFCGMCGVGLERRKVERRFTSIQSSRRCPSCDHVNEAGYKFCANCGGRVERRVGERRTDEERAAAIANAQLPTPDGPSVAVSESEPIDTNAVPDTSSSAEPSFHLRDARRTPNTTIGGPSFLGLSDDNGNGDYLLEDEGSSGGVLRRLVLIAVLAALGGLVFVQWKSGFPIFYAISGRSAIPAKPEPASPAEQELKSEAIATEQTHAQSRTPDLARDASAAHDAAVTAKNKPPTDLTPIDDSMTAVPASPATGATAPGSTLAAAVNAKAKAAKNEQEPPSPLLLRAQQYLQGTGGVSRNCEQGLVYLRAAAKNEAAAAVQMGALYASGHCVPTDRVQAYRWLNSAHELQPGNASIQTSMNELWALMTVQERSQIVR